MIISASRRTDIPTYYSEWFMNRIREGFVLVRNPMSFHQISRISLSPDVVDGIVFWTKNPIPMLDKLNQLKHYKFYFQFTITSYGKDIEPKSVKTNTEKHDPSSPLLFGKVCPDDVIKERKVESCRDIQMNLMNVFFKDE